jgi:hypothetical protein
MEMSTEDSFLLFRRAVRMGDIPIALSLMPKASKSRLQFCRDLYLILSEDIGPANPSLFIDVDNMISSISLDDTKALKEIVEILTRSLKSNIFTWISGVMILNADNKIAPDMNKDEVFMCLRCYLSNLDQYLLDRLFEKAVETSFKIRDLYTAYPDFVITTELWKKLKLEYPCPVIVKHLSSIHHQFWIPMISHVIHRNGSQKLANLVCHIYYTTCVRIGPLTFRDIMANSCHWIHAIWAICNDEIIETTWDERIPAKSPMKEHNLDLKQCGDSLEDVIYIHLRNTNVPHRLIKDENRWLDRFLDTCNNLKYI